MLLAGQAVFSESGEPAPHPEACSPSALSNGQPSLQDSSTRLQRAVRSAVPSQQSSFTSEHLAAWDAGSPLPLSPSLSSRIPFSSLQLHTYKTKATTDTGLHIAAPKRCHFAQLTGHLNGFMKQGTKMALVTLAAWIGHLAEEVCWAHHQQ